MARSFSIHPDLALARTPGAEFYSDPQQHDDLCRAVFAGAWQLVPEACPLEQSVAGTWRAPWGEECLWLIPGQGAWSDVCTHRGHPLELGRDELRCPYHGRRFGLDGQCKGQKGMQGSQGFPAKEDALRAVPIEQRGLLTWAAPNPGLGFGAAYPDLDLICAALNWKKLVRDPSGDRAHRVQANWILYVENYLEGLHVPFVHPGLAKNLDLGAYETRLLGRGVLQVGRVGAGESMLDLPDGHPDGQDGPVGALYLWCYPNLMLNLYPWGLSVNQVEPTGPGSCLVRYLRFVQPGIARAGAGGDLDQVELEDQSVVEAVQRRSGSVGRVPGRYSPDFEAGVHHFHRLLASSLVAGAETA